MLAWSGRAYLFQDAHVVVLVRLSVEESRASIRRYSVGYL